jgi:uncharacterized protein (DUF2062 family)
MKFGRALKLFFIKMARTRASTEEISWGAAIGTFASVFPTFGFGMPFVLLLSKFVRFNLLSAVAVSVVSNPLTSPFFMLFSYKIGSVILNKNIEFNIDNWRDNLSETGFVLLLGSLVVSGTLSVLAYFLTAFIVKQYRAKKMLTK